MPLRGIGPFIAAGPLAMVIGGALVTVHDVDQDCADLVRRIMKRHGALDTESLSKEIG